MKRIKTLLVVALVMVGLMPSVALGAELETGTAKNVIVMIPDGMSVEALTLARWFSDDYEMALDEMAVGLMKTHNANTPIADSAPAGTAMATGVKSESPFVGIYPSEGGMPGAEDFDEAYAMRPLANVLEGAMRTGRATGIVSTSNIQHATPADFSSHYPDRNNYEMIGEQQVYQGMDVVLGAGYSHLDPSVRKDGEDLLQEIQDLGYEYVTTPEELEAAEGEKLWGLFAEGSFTYAVDRKEEEEPSLADMTDKALQTLTKNEEGFFLMVEGSEIDWAGHANDPVAIIHEILAFDEAVQVAKEFVDANEDTVLVVASDHGTGGVTFGNVDISKGYDTTPLEDFTKIIKDVTASTQVIAAEVEEDRSNVKEVVEKYYPIELTEEEETNLKETETLAEAIGMLISKKSYIGWTTNGHVGGDVGLYYYANAERAVPLGGTRNNTEIGQYVAGLMELDLASLTEELYQPLTEGFEALGAEVVIEEIGEEDYQATVTKDEQTLVFPVAKNYALNGEEHVELDGIIVYSDGEMYVPQSAFDLIK